MDRDDDKTLDGIKDGKEDLAERNDTCLLVISHWFIIAVHFMIHGNPFTEAPCAISFVIVKQLRLQIFKDEHTKD